MLHGKERSVEVCEAGLVFGGNDCLGDFRFQTDGNVDTLVDLFQLTGFQYESSHIHDEAWIYVLCVNDGRGNFREIY